MKNGEGTTYILSIADEALVTLLLYPTMTNSDLQDKLEEAEIKKKSKDMKEKVKLLTLTNFEYIISLDEPPPTPDLIDANSLDYKIKAAYRKKTPFTHNKYGTGKVINAASGGTRAGEPDSRGMVEWVEVDFNQPYYVSGEFKKYRIIKNVYTTLSPLIDPDTI